MYGTPSLWQKTWNGGIIVVPGKSVSSFILDGLRQNYLAWQPVLSCDVFTFIILWLTSLSVPTRSYHWHICGFNWITLYLKKKKKMVFYCSQYRRDNEVDKLISHMHSSKSRTDTEDSAASFITQLISRAGFSRCSYDKWLKTRILR